MTTENDKSEPGSGFPASASGIAVIIVAAGRGRRLGGEVPKQYIPLAGKSALRRSVEAFLTFDRVTGIIPVIHGDDRRHFETAMDGLDDRKVLPAVEGGEMRGLSVRRGLEAVKHLDPSLVLIHDAARPFVPSRVIGDVIAALDSAEGACAGLPVVDALWKTENGIATAAVDRTGLWRAQTPQGFHFDRILKAHLSHDGSGADDVAVAREAGMKVKFILGSERNYKITTKADLDRAQADAAAL